MLKTSLGPTRKVSAAKALVLFAIGGHRLAARADEVAEVRPWTDSMPVPSETPYIGGLVRHGEEVLPVYDMATRLNVQVLGSSPLCLVAKRRDGPVALCIDADIPTLRNADTASVRSVAGDNPDVVAICHFEEEDVPIYSLSTLGQATSRYS